MAGSDGNNTEHKMCHHFCVFFHPDSSSAMAVFQVSVDPFYAASLTKSF